ncbi:MAG: DUF4154 domain-containing protein [Salinivirgaceae bacterium]|nr:DUF4154 domain-containing protein [Salinivirgaceae bacterium]
MLTIFLKFIASAALLFAFYRIVLRGKASYTVSRAYLLALPIISVIFSVVTFEVYPSGTEIAIEQIDFGHYTAPATPVETDYVPDVAPVQVTNTAAAPAAVQAPAPSAAPVQEKRPIVIDWMALLQWGIPAVSLLLLLLAVYYICKVLVIKSRMNVETTAEGYSLISSPNVDTPFSFAKTIFLPTSLNEPGKSLIIRHEKAHIRHRHYADVWFMELITRLLWFNPFVWLCRNELRNVHEFQADHDVISSDVNINAYQTTLLEMVMNVSSPVVNGFNHSFIRRRFVEMKSTAAGTLGRVAKIGTLVWFVAMFCAFTFTEKKSEPNPAAALSPTGRTAEQKLLMECKSMVNYSHSLTKNWVYIERASDTPDKLALKKIHNEQFPELQSELLEVSEKWNNSDREELESIFTFINDTLFAYQKDIMKALNSIADYDDMFNMLEIQIMVQDDEDAVETNAANKAVARIDALIEKIKVGGTAPTPTKNVAVQTLGPGKFVIEGAVDPGITDSCYLIYFADENFEIIETPVACVPVVDKKFHYEVELNDLTVCRIRCIFPGGEICSDWIETFAAPGVTFGLTVRNGFYTPSSQYSNYLSKIRRLADTYCKNHHLDENVAKPDGLYKTWENVKYGNWNNHKVEKVEFCEKKTTVTLSPSRWERSELSSDACLRDTAGNLYKMLHNESTGNRYIDYIRGARYSFEPLPKGVTKFDMVSKSDPNIPAELAKLFTKNTPGGYTNVIVADITEDLNVNQKPNFNITFKTELKNEVTGCTFEIVGDNDIQTGNARLLGDIDLDSNGEGTFSTYLGEPCIVWIIPTFADAPSVISRQISIPFVPGENAQFTLVSTGLQKNGSRFTMEMPSYQLTGSKFYAEWEKAGKKFNEMFDKQGDKANAAINEYVKKNGSNLGLVMQYLIGPWNADYSILPQKTLQNPMVKFLKKRDDEFNKMIEESQKRRDEARANTAPGKMFIDVDLQNMRNQNNRPSLSDIIGKGRHVLVNFCYPPSKKDTETGKAIDAMLEKYKEKPIDAISIECNYISGPDSFKDILKGFGVSHKVYYDVNHQANRMYGFGNGEIILFGPDGTILWRDIAADELELTIENVLNGKATTHPVYSNPLQDSKVESPQQGSTTGYSSQDDKYKAMFIYNFTKQIEWPAKETKGDFVICVVNQDNMLKQLKEIAKGKTVGKSTISVVGAKNIDEISKCQILYLPTDESSTDKVKAVMAKFGNAATLIVTDSPEALENGSCVNFVEIDDKIKYEINKKAIEDRNMKVLYSMAVNAIK